MSGVDAFLGVDIGTSGAKALLIDAAGAVLCEGAAAYSLSTPYPLWAEQDALDWWAGFVVAVRAALAAAPPAARVAAIGLTGQMHGLTLLDRHGVPLRPAILWNDQRTAAQCDLLTERAGGAAKVIERTGNPVLPGFTAPKLLWVRRHEPDVWVRIDKALLPKDYVRFRLTGAACSDVADASGTSLFDVEQRRWSAEMCAAAEVSPYWLPSVCESQVVCSHVSATAAAEVGLPAGTPVVAGAGDQAAQAIGAGTLRGGDVSVTIGTSGVVFAASDSFRVDPHGRLHAFCHAAPGRWHLMGVMLSAGGSLRWGRDALAAGEREQARAKGRDVYELLAELAARAPVGCEGLSFLPYLCGERTPYADPRVRGAFVGLTLRHAKEHVMRSIFEGVSFGLRDSLELVRELGAAPRQIRVSGGGGRSEFWRQMLADVFNTAVAPLQHEHGAAFGAALLAAVGVGRFQNIEAACTNCVRIGPPVAPRPGTRDDYERAYQRYRALYPALRPVFWS